MATEYVKETQDHPNAASAALAAHDAIEYSSFSGDQKGTLSAIVTAITGYGKSHPDEPGATDGSEKKSADNAE